MPETGLSGYLVCPVYLVSLVQSNIQDRRDRPDRPNEQGPLGRSSLGWLLAVDDIRNSYPALFMSTSAAIADPLLRRAFGQRARPSDPPRTARVRLGSSRLRALVSQRGSAISRRTVMNNAGYDP